MCERVSEVGRGGGGGGRGAGEMEGGGRRVGAEREEGSVV